MKDALHNAAGPPAVKSDERRVTSHHRESVGTKAAWLLLAGLLLMVAPSQIWLSEPVWQRGAEAMVRAAGLAVAFWVGVALAPSTDRGVPRSAFPVLSAAAVPLAAFYLVVMTVGESYSRGVLLVGTALLGLLVAARWLFVRRIRPASLVLAGALGVVVVLGLVSRPPARTPAMYTPIDTLFTHRGRLAGTHLSDLGDTIRGGGLTRVGDDMLLVTGAGEFFRVALAGGRFDAEPLSLRAPLNRDDFVAATDTTVLRSRFRVAGILAQPSAESVRVLVSHHFWKAEEACFVLRLSETMLAADLGAGVGGGNRGDPIEWRTLFETTPCLGIKEKGEPFAGQQVGGRIAALGDSALILTVGDHQFDGVNAKRVLSQAADNDYGKTILIPGTGSARTFTLGHRNPQGLVVTAAGEAWITEHGPRGGDELNRLVDGGNYGWPLQTLGTQYGELSWPFDDPARTSGGFVTAEFAWVPSIGVSNLIEIRTDAVAGWKGDLLVAGLQGRGLYRLHREDGRIVYSERIHVGARVRDLAEAADGRLVIWFDDGQLSVFAPIDGL